MKTTYIIKIGVQVNWDETYLTQRKCFSFKPGMESFSLKWDVPHRWDVTSYKQPLIYKY